MLILAATINHARCWVFL